ncbi:MAG TPA: amidohydrolase family protein [Candidatus Eisenbacteria bacterium]|nr:amidohydrolase family protein [Candidatus Eisenbacteria bacterium]
MKPSLAVLCVLLLAGGWLVSCAAPAENSIAITHVTVIDMTGAPPLAEQTVLIRKQRIAAVGPAGAIGIPRGAKIVDGAGKFLIPGLTDMHVHLTAAGEPDGSRRFMIPLLLTNGITTVRDMGGYLESLIPLRKEIEQGKRLGPRIFYAGPYLDGSPPSFEPSFVVTNRTQANEDVRLLVQRGVDFIKVQSILSRDAYFAIADAARREHMPFEGHVPDHVTAAEAADAGQRSIEHLTNVLRGCSRDEAKLMRDQFYVPPKKETTAQAHARLVHWQRELLQSFSQTNADALIARFAAKEVWQTPTLVLLKHDAFPTPGNIDRGRENEKYIPKVTLENWRKGRAAQMQLVNQPESGLREILFARSGALVGRMQKRGVDVLAGTDTPAPDVVPGFALHEELALLVEAGLTPMQALQSATSSAARFLGKERDSGTVLAGKYADLALLDGDPLENIQNSGKIRAVVVRGRYLDRQALDGLLAEEMSFAGQD